MEQYIKTVSKFIIRKGFAVGRELTDHLQAKFHVTAANAHQIVVRLVKAGKISSSKPVTFGNGQFIYFLPGAYLHYEMILAVCKEFRPPLYRILSVMKLQGGIISFFEAMKLAASVEDNSKTKKDVLKKIIDELFLLKLVKTTEDDQGGKFIYFAQDEYRRDMLVLMHRQRMKSDAIFIPDLLRMVQRMNLIHNQYVQYRSKERPFVGVSHNNHVWDAVGYTKTTGINPGKASLADSPEKQTLIVFDVLIYRHYTFNDFQGFYSRIQSVIHSVKNGQRKVMPIIVVSQFENSHVQNTSRKLGFLTFTLGNIYGERIYEIVRNISALKQNALSEGGNVIASAVENTLSIIQSTGQTSNLQNLRGDLFESLLYPLFKELYGNATITPSRSIKLDGDEKSFQFDYIIELGNPKQAIVVELKGYHYSKWIALGDTETRNTVSWFFGKAFPVARAQLLRESPGRKVAACMITTAHFEAEAIPFLQAQNNGKLRPAYIDSWYDGDKLLRLMDERGLTHIKEIVEKYYIPPSELSGSSHELEINKVGIVDDIEW